LVARAAEELRELSKQGELSEQSIEALRKRLEALGN
jgi:phage tail tape-measure protein